MANLAADTPIQAQGVNLTAPVNGVIKTSDQLYVGSIVDLTTGKVTLHVPGGVIMGVVVGAAQPGDDPMIYPVASGTQNAIPVGDGTVQVQVETGEFLVGGDGSIDAITGLPGAATEPGTLVWAIDDNVQALTSVDPGAEIAFGVITSWSSSMGYQIKVFSWSRRQVTT